MNDYNQVLLNAVLQRVKRSYKEAVALIGICGSEASGDTYEKSDLDLLILLDNEKGQELATCFILDDPGVGFDFYCYDWSRLEHEAEVHSAYLSKVLDLKTVYVKDRETADRFQALQEKASSILKSDTRLERVEEALQQAKLVFSEVVLTDSLASARVQASLCLSALFDALMLSRGLYFHYGVKRNLEELHQLDLKPEFFENVEAVTSAQTIEQITTALRALLLEASDFITSPCALSTPSPESITGSYEEMFSNWRNKVEAAAASGDRYASFVNLCGLQMMLDEMHADAGTERFDVMDQFDPEDLAHNLTIYDEALARYLKNYENLGMSVCRYPNAAAFAAAFAEK